MEQTTFDFVASDEHSITMDLDTHPQDNDYRSRVEGAIMDAVDEYLQLASIDDLYILIESRVN